MKNFLLKFVILLFSLGIVYQSSCKHEPFEPNNERHKENIITNLKSGIWEIETLIESGEDETSKFNNYTFTFKSIDAVQADSMGTIYNGIWKIKYDDDYDEDDLELTVKFDNPEKLKDLDDIKDVESYSKELITLVDDDDKLILRKTE